MGSGSNKRKRPLNTTDEEASEALIIGLDFGTTFNNTEISSILDWPGGEGFESPKVPSVISCDFHGKDSFTWGAQRHRFEKIEGIKLLLDPDQETPLYLSSSTSSIAAKIERLGKSALSVATDYISAIYQHAKKFVITVPAVWSDKAKDVTLQAAKLAGIYPVTVIKEPEAAALYTLHLLHEKALAVGDAFVICDAGGGTCDLISYEITALKPRLELKELVPGKGSMSDSLGLNKRFKQAVKDLLGEDQYAKLRKTRGFEEAVTQFDRSIKTASRGQSDEEYFLNFPMAQLENDPITALKQTAGI